MNVLLVNPGYPQTFLSFDRSLKLLGKQVLVPPLGLITVAALLPRDWEFRLVELTAHRISEEDWAWCDLLLISGMSTQYTGIIETIREGRKREKTVVVGGPWVFHFPQKAIEAGADIVVKGEAEYAIRHLLESLSKRTSGIVIEPDGRSPLDDIPPPRHDLLDTALYADMAVQFSRGCPFRCEFCDITLMFGRGVRTKPPGHILRELEILYDLGWRRNVFFVDDNFIANPKKAKRLLSELTAWMNGRGHPFEFFTQASVDLAEDSELLDLMVRAGFRKVFLGIETLDKEILELTKKQPNLTVHLDTACEKINRAGLQIIAGCIMGFDNERPRAGQRLIEFAVRNRIPELFVTLLQAAPGTDLWTRLQQEGRLLPSPAGESFTNQTALPNFVPTRPIGQIVDEFTHLYDVLYDPAAYLARAYEHVLAMGRSSVKRHFALPYLSELRAVLILLFRQGLLGSSRRTFWKLFCCGLLKFPDRFHQFISHCIMLEHYREYRHIVRNKVRESLAQREVQ